MKFHENRSHGSQGITGKVYCSLSRLPLIIVQSQTDLPVCSTCVLIAGMNSEECSSNGRLGTTEKLLFAPSV